MLFQDKSSICYGLKLARNIPVWSRVLNKGRWERTIKRHCGIVNGPWRPCDSCGSERQHHVSTYQDWSGEPVLYSYAERWCRLYQGYLSYIPPFTRVPIVTQAANTWLRNAWFYSLFKRLVPDSIWNIFVFRDLDAKIIIKHIKRDVTALWCSGHIGFAGISRNRKKSQAEGLEPGDRSLTGIQKCCQRINKENK